MTSVIDLIRKYHTLGEPTLTVPTGPPVSSDRAKFPWVLFYFGVQSLRDVVTLTGRGYVFYARSRSKRRLSLSLCSEILRDGVTLTGQGNIFCARSRSKRRRSLNLCSEILRDGVTLPGRGYILRMLSIEKKTPSEPMFIDPSRWGHPFGSSLFPFYMLDHNEGSL